MPGRAPVTGSTWPPAFQTPARDVQTGDVAFPPPWAPSAGTLDYTVKAITALFLVLALPYVARRLVTNPAGLVGDLGRKHTKA
jgi:hypothetical protein